VRDSFRRVLRAEFSTLSLVVASLTVAAFVAGIVFSSITRTAIEVPRLPPGTMRACIEQRLATIKSEKTDLAGLDAASESCYREFRSEFLLNDFYHRKAKFLEQSRDGYVLLWVVVVITLSGVGLSALQLVASYRLASAGRGSLDTTGELSLERDKVSLKSSVTGLFILVFSFAFFALFVAEVYKIKELRVENPPIAAPEQAKQIDTAPLIPFENAGSSPVSATSK